MKVSIRWRLVTMYVLLVVIVMMVSGTMIVLMVRESEKNALQDDVVAAVENIKNSMNEGSTVEEIQQELKDTYLYSPDFFSNKRVFLLDTRARVVLPEKFAELEWKFPTHQVTGAINDGDYPKFDDKRTLPNDDKKYIGYADNIKIGDDVVYVLYVLGDKTEITETVKRTVNIILMAIGVALVIAVFLGYLFSEFLTQPISALSLKAKDMAAGELDKLMKVQSRDEIGQLTHDFNSMAISLNEKLNEITSEKNKLDIVFEHMTDGILVFDRMGVMIHSNPASVQMLKLDREISFSEVFKSYLDLTYVEMKKMVKEETVSHLVMVEGKYYSVYFAKFIDQSKEAVGLICVIQDITEHKKLEEMQKEFVANVSHELRTPLTTIKSYAETLLEGAVDDLETTNRFLSVINHEGDRMTALVQDLLELSKLDNSQVQFTMNNINLEHVLTDSVEKYKIHADKKSQSLIYHKPSFECRISGDANRIEQVFKNIISNAVKYSPESALIEVVVKESNKYFIVRVSDSGFGMSKEDLGRIFERFYRVDKARSREMGGTGLGLAIAKEIMEHHGGRIEVESELGKGTNFDLYFPKHL